MICMAYPIEQVKAWTEAISKEQADAYLESVTPNQQKEDSKTGFRAYLKSFWSRGDSQEVDEKDSEEEDDDEEKKLESI
jgi:hypothetical protein